VTLIRKTLVALLAIEAFGVRGLHRCARARARKPVAHYSCRVERRQEGSSTDMAWALAAGCDALVLKTAVPDVFLREARRLEDGRLNDPVPYSRTAGNRSHLDQKLDGR